jgi:Fe-S-cluster containining protein
MSQDCSCNACKSACEFKPGWFKPGEVEKVAKFLKLSKKDLFDNRLMVDWYISPGEHEGDVFVLSPAVVGRVPGAEFPGNPRGQCVFFKKNGKCEIHEVKPFECREMLHGESEDVVSSRHEAIGVSWIRHQRQITNLLGRKPQSTECSVADFLFSLRGWRPFPF